MKNKARLGVQDSALITLLCLHTSNEDLLYSKTIHISINEPSYFDYITAS